MAAKSDGLEFRDTLSRREAWPRARATSLPPAWRRARPTRFVLSAAKAAMVCFREWALVQLCVWRNCASRKSLKISVLRSLADLYRPSRKK
tara:strand:+ start:5189 stop:5461 length:273 start_codon:yes stop_codon:yes gene_type:complete